MPNPWKEKVLKFNKKRKLQNEKANDFAILLSALPPGQVKQLLKDETCSAILSKYGITGS